MPLLIDTSDSRVLTLRFVGGYTDADLTRFLEQLAESVNRPGGRVCIIDLSSAVPGSAAQRKTMGEWIRRHESLLARWIVATAVVTDNAIVRGTVTAVFWIRPLPMDNRVFATLSDARTWLEPYIAAL